MGPFIRSEQRVLRYGTAIFLVLAIGAVRWALKPLAGTEAPLLPFLLAILIAACLAGRGPALVATALTPFLVTPLFTAWPTGTHHLAYATHVGLFLVMSVATTLLVHRLQLSSREQQQSLEAALAAKRQASASESRLRLITDALPALIAYVGPDYRYRFNNRRYEEWFGKSPEMMPVHEILGETAYASVEPRLTEALAGQPAMFETQFPHQTAGLRQVEVHYLPDVDPQGVVRGCFVLVTDITARKQAERALRGSERMLKLIYDNSSDALCLLEMDTARAPRVLSVNERFLNVTGLVRADVEDRYLDEIERGIDPARLCAKCEAVVMSRRPLIYNEAGDLVAGHRRSEITLIPIVVGETVTHILAASKDVTEKVLAEEALREADRRKDDFLAMLAHELRNPLAPIRNVAHVLSSHDIEAEVVRRQADVLQRQANQLAHLVDDLLDVARITRGLIELKRAPVRLATVIESAIETAQPLVTVKHQTLSVAGAAEPLWIDGDAVRLTQAIGNLLTNAAKYSPDGSPIEVVVNATDAEALIRIIDRGDGIDAEVLPHVFELFMQADRSLDRSQGGLGVGLTIVKALIEMHGGGVEARSGGVGQGSEFIVRLPLCSPVRPSAQAPAPVVTPPVRLRVLVVDDNVDSAESLSLLLSVSGHEVRMAHDGAAALAALEMFDAQIVLLDIGLPGNDGYVVAQAIRERFPRKGRRLYALTGYGSPEDRALALRAGFDDHLTKPVDPMRLLQLISQQSTVAAVQDAVSYDST